MAPAIGLYIRIASLVFWPLFGVLAGRGGLIGTMFGYFGTLFRAIWRHVLLRWLKMCGIISLCDRILLYDMTILRNNSFIKSWCWRYRAPVWVAWISRWYLVGVGIIGILHVSVDLKYWILPVSSRYWYYVYCGRSSSVWLACPSRWCLWYQYFIGIDSIGYLLGIGKVGTSSASVAWASNRHQ